MSARRPERRRTGLTAAAAVALLAGGVVAAPAAAAAVTPCAGVRATIVGTARGEFLRGTDGRDVIVARGGRDTVDAKGGDDLVCGGDGADRLAGGSGSDQLRGEAGDDLLAGDPAFRKLTDVVVGADLLVGGGGLDTAALWKHKNASGRITVDLGAGSARGQGRDTLRSVEAVDAESPHDDLLVGSPGTDVFYSGAGNDVERGRGGDDVFLAARGDDRHEGGAGSDTVDMGLTWQAVVSLISDTARSEGTGTDRLISVENAAGSDGNDVLTGDAEANVLDGAGGQDVLRGLAGDDHLLGGSNDSAPDAVDSLAGGPGDDVIDGGTPTRKDDQRDEVDYTGSDVPVTVDLAAGRATGDGTDTLVRVEDVIGSSGDDVLSGGAGPNELNGTAE